jgi:aminopeptidase N
MAVYNAAVYDRGQAMYQALHDIMGEELFQRFLRAYYATWQFRHVDRWAMQAVAEQTSAQSLGWFFTQWVQEVGVVDYALRAPVVRTEQVGGRTQWIVTASLTRAGRYRHPMPVGVRTRDGWTIWRANPLLDTQVVQFRLDAAPDALWLDPYGSTESPTARYYRISLPSR